MAKNQTYELVINGKTYLLVDSVDVNGYKYFSSVLLDENKEMTSTYQFFKKYNKNNEDYIDIIRSEDELASVCKAMIEKVSENFYTKLPKTGSVIGFRDTDYVVLSYIPYNNEVYAIMITLPDVPVDIVVAKVEIDEDGDIAMKDESYSDVAVAVMQIHSIIYGNKEK